ncbi:MAG: TGS domain-containing protein [archaeon]
MKKQFAAAYCMANAKASELIETSLGKAGAIEKGAQKSEIELLEKSVGQIMEMRPDASTVRGMAFFCLKSISNELAKALEKDGEAKEIALELERIETILGQELSDEEKRKIAVAACRDFRAIIAMLGIQIARTANMGESDQRQRKKQAELAMRVFAPIAHKLGIYYAKAILEDLAFRELQPEECRLLEERIAERRKGIEDEIGKVMEAIRERLGSRAESGKIRIQARAKHIYSAWNKMQKKKIGLEQVYDIAAVRIITKTVAECYELLGTVHSLWEPLPGQFDDYIAKPKPNGYRSLHTAIIGPGKKPIEIQIRTEEMHENAELGIAAHWRYKGQAEGKQDKKLNWLKQAIEWRNGREGEESKLDFFENQIYVFTPKGQVIELPEGSTPIDFAYTVHTDIGSKCAKAKVNGKLAPLSAKLENADTVQIITSQKQAPKRSWLSMAITQKALQKIRASLEIAVIKKKRGEAVKGKGRVFIEENEKRVKLAKCCSPLPGDEVIALRTTKRKVSVHRADCRNAVSAEKEKLVGAIWGNPEKGGYETQIIVNAKDSAGILSQMLSSLSAERAKVVSSTARSVNGNNRCVFTVKVAGLGQLENAIRALEKIKGVISAGRA